MKKSPQCGRVVSGPGQSCSGDAGYTASLRPDQSANGPWRGGGRSKVCVGRGTGFQSCLPNRQDWNPVPRSRKILPHPEGTASTGGRSLRQGSASISAEKLLTDRNRTGTLRLNPGRSSRHWWLPRLHGSPSDNPSPPYGRIPATDLPNRTPSQVESKGDRSMLRRVWILSGALVAMGLPSLWSGERDHKLVEAPSAPQRWGADGPGGVPGFTRHVQPLLGK